MAAHFCIGNPCHLCFPALAPKKIEWSEGVVTKDTEFEHGVIEKLDRIEKLIKKQDC